MFFPNLTAYMSSGPLVAMILARYNAISYWKELLGPSNSLVAKETHPDSLRAIYGTDELRNALHGSNDFAAAEREIRFMFPAVIVEPIPVGQAAKDYLNLYVMPTLLKGLTELCKQKPADPFFYQVIATTHLPPPSCTRCQSCNPMDCSPPSSSVHGLFQIWLADWLLKNNPNKPKLCHHPVAE
ncbi:nucleoside diphosphate kinase homolog 5 isoform X1 [Bubalus kerabau]|uniref:nucleoside diphosphate kinase homolog 5 isoform X1 n=1 Tax=Bubalus carabanensis TaxID=3119969 RepID=UPI00244E9CDE|nr:nucleoside diphosphate kinase homolog 5 isoform X1 [Bubalus carabanensis]